MPPKRKIPEGKRELSVLISEKTYRMVAELAPKIYGKYRGALSEAVEEALNFWLEAHKIEKTSVNPPLSIREKYNKILRELRKLKGFIPIKVSRIDFEKAMLRVPRMTTKKTRYHWLHTFYMMGFIKPLGIKVFSERSWKNVIAIEIVAKEV